MRPKTEDLIWENQNLYIEIETVIGIVAVRI